MKTINKAAAIEEISNGAALHVGGTMAHVCTTAGDMLRVRLSTAEKIAEQFRMVAYTNGVGIYRA